MNVVTYKLANQSGSIDLCDKHSGYNAYGTKLGQVERGAHRGHCWACFIDLDAIIASITDEQILSLEREAIEAGDGEMVDDCQSALRGESVGRRSVALAIRSARAAEIG